MTIGYDNVRVNQGLLLDLRFQEGSGLITRDFATPQHKDPTLTGAPAWAQRANGLNVLDFNPGHPDFIQIAGVDSADLDFTTEDFSALIWVYLDTNANGNVLLGRGLSNTDGWDFGVLNSGAFYMRTNQGGANQYTAGGPTTLGAWYMLGFVRSNTVVRMYAQGVDVTTTPSTHVDPLTSARKLHVGVSESETSTYAVDGKMYRPRIWSRALPASEIKFIYESERGLLGV